MADITTVRSASNEPVIVKKQIDIVDLAQTYYLRNTAKNSEKLVANTSKQLTELEYISDGVEKLGNKIASQTNILKQTLDHAEKTAINTEVTALIARKADEERREQKEIKNAVFAFKQDYDLAKSTSTGLALHIKLSTLSSIASSSLKKYINKLDEIADKEYAYQLSDSVINDLAKTYDLLDELERKDLSHIENLSKKLDEAQKNMNELIAQYAAEKEAYAKIMMEIEKLELQLNRMQEINSSRPSRIFATFKILFSLFLLVILSGFPLLLLLIGRVRKFLGGAFSAIVSRAINTKEYEDGLSSLQDNAEQRIQALNKVESYLHEADASMEHIETEMNIIYQKYGLNTI
ncbi:MAG: guided entry of tail-anchored proteins factor 1 [Burkholderiales bacterium]